MFFLYFAAILSAVVILTIVLPLPVGRTAKALLALAVILCAGRLAIMRALFGGMGGVEAGKALLYATSFLQDVVIFLFVLGALRGAVLLLSLPTIAIPGAAEGGAAFRRVLMGVNLTLALTAFAALLSGLGLYWAAKVPEVREHTLALPNTPPELDGLRIAVIADLHISRFFDHKWSGELVKRVNALDPDLILMPGDLVDGAPALRAADVEPLSRLKSRYGKFFSAGNHEYISGLPEWLPVFQALGLQNLYNLNVPVRLRGTTIYLAGVTDPAAWGRNLPGPDLPAALRGVPDDGHLVILLEHRPSSARENAGDKRISLQVSGHTHGGLFPVLKALTKRANRGYLSGWYDVGQMKLFVHPGSGLWSGVPARILDPSEISLITLRAPARKPERAEGG
jgi:predicted MPP superfamily phosphohydrolase